MWLEKLSSVEDAMKANTWSTAEERLKTLLKDLDATSKQVEETQELLKFVEDEWRILRNQCEASGIRVDDQERLACEGSVAEARTHLEKGDVDAALIALGTCDEYMEKLRRRI